MKASDHIEPDVRQNAPNARLRHRMYTEPFGAIEIIDYEPQYKADFKRLNLEWIEYYFEVEPIDIEFLSNPETYFLQPGGYIFFAICCEQIVGTCALLLHSDRGFELSKMGVMKPYRGAGIGKKLVETAIDRIKSLDEKHIFLETNSRLIPAMHLYKKLGFENRPFPHGRSERYQRADTYMVLELDKPSSNLKPGWL